MQSIRKSVGYKKDPSNTNQKNRILNIRMKAWKYETVDLLPFVCTIVVLDCIKKARFGN